MIKLTALHYKLKRDFLLRYHNINEHNEGLLFEWSQAVERAQSVGGEYPEKPFIEPFEFQDDDYTITKKIFRVRLNDIFSYKENADNIVEITVSGDVTYTIKESVKEIDDLFF